MTTRLTRPVGLRGRLLASVALGIGLLLTVLTVAFNVVLADRLNRDARGVAQARASAELSSLTVRSGHIRLAEAPDERTPDAQLWVFQGRAPIEEPQAAAPGVDHAATALAKGAPAIRDVARTNTRLLALPVIQSGKRVGAVVAGVSLTPYEQTRETALIASVALAAAIFLTVALAASWLISKALGPVAHMTRQAAEWSEHDIDRRFSLGAPRDELTQLAATLDGLLDRLSASLRHEQRLSAELSHELRTPLASIAADAQYALRHADLSHDGRATVENILRCANRMARTLDTLIAAARAQLDPHRATSDATECARAALEASGHTSGAHPRASVQGLPGVRVAVEQDLVERVLVPLIENARRHAAQSVEVAVARAGPDVMFTVIDDGEGLPEDRLEDIFEPGRRAGNGAVVTASAGLGLGLALARRLARSAGGEVRADASDHGGCFTVRLPAA